MEHIGQKPTESDEFGNNRWYTILRKMSMKGTPEEIISGTEGKFPEKPITEDSTLPTVQECIGKEGYEIVTSYFENPFGIESNITIDSQMKISADIHPFESEKSKAKLQWTKSFEKIKMMNHLKEHTATGTNTISNLPLAPYYPPAVLPPYLCLISKDEYGRKP
ncbi:hypothetical protein CU098_003386, partial [Rhizopus stolonifer]